MRAEERAREAEINVAFTEKTRACNAYDEECGGGLTWDGTEWRERLAGGGYLGFGGSTRFGQLQRFSFSIFARTRLQLSGAEAIPATLWWSVSGGLQVTILGHFRLYSSGGYAMYYNEVDRQEGLIAEGGIGILAGPGSMWGSERRGHR